MTGLISAGIGAAGAIGSAVLPGLFGGKGGTSGTQGGASGSNTISGPAPGSPYEVFQNQQLANISNLSQQPYQPYDVNSMFAGFNADQNAGFAGVRGAGGSWQYPFSQAYGALGANSGAAYDPTKAAAGAFSQASGTPTALGTANPYATTAAQMTPDVINGYMNPYIDKVVNNANRLQTDNYMKNVLPGITNQFVSSGGGLGSSQYGKGVDWSLGNFNRAIGDTTQTALAQGWNSATGAAQNDLARQAGLAGTMGNLALGDLSGRTNLATAQGNNAAQGAATNVNNANAWQQLGTNDLNNNLTWSNAMLGIGNQQQQQAQLPLTAAYQQFKEQQQYPFQTAGWAANTANQYQWPTRQNTSGFNMGSTSQTSSSQASPLSTGLGIASTVGAMIPGMSDWFGNTVGQNASGFAPGGGPQGPSGGAMAARGGYLRMNTPSMPPKMQSAFKNTYATGGYLGLNATTPAVKAQPAYGEPAIVEHDFDNFDHASMPPMMRPAFANTYKKGGPVGKKAAVKAVHAHEKNMHKGKPMTPIKKLAQGGYLGMNEASCPPKAQPAFKDTYATGGSVVVIKAAKKNTQRSMKALRKKNALEERMARPELPIDLSARSGHFQ